MAIPGPVHASYASYTVPNARCPVCSASVFLYQSPNGGRVFFDELGPPWPKQPCTDKPAPSRQRPAATHVRSGSVLDDLVFAPQSLLAPTVQKLVAPHEWRPLCRQERGPEQSLGKHVCFPVVARDRVPGNRLYVPEAWPGAAPIYWRWSPDHAGMVELATIRFDVNLIPTKITTCIPGWLRSDKEYLAWLEDPEQPVDHGQLYALGWAFSFAWKIPGIERWDILFPAVDLARARRFFEAAAKTGCWASLNNLGVIYRDGLGVNPNPAMAFAFFQQASKEGNARVPASI